MLPQSCSELDKLAVTLKSHQQGHQQSYQQKDASRIMITGHSDYLGDDFYHLNLSQLRAQTVRKYLANRDVNLSSMIATGAGELEPVKQCAPNQSRSQRIDCL